MQSQVRFNRVPEKFRQALVQSQVRFNRVPEKVPEKVREALAQSQVRFNRICGHFIHRNPADVFQRFASQHASERFVKIERCDCWGYHRSLSIFYRKSVAGKSRFQRMTAWQATCKQGFSQTFFPLARFSTFSGNSLEGTKSELVTPQLEHETRLLDM